MKVEELRIGSLIQLYRKAEDKEMSIHFVSGIENNPDIGWMVEIEDGFYINVDKGIEPIPLTEEWLVKFGFSVYESNHHNITIAKVDGFAINTYAKDGDDYWWLGYYHNKKNKHIKYVHQLQNLYFDLTGEELIINL